MGLVFLKNLPAIKLEKKKKKDEMKIKGIR